MASEKQINVGGVLIGGGATVAVQSMTTTKTFDADATLAQIARLHEAGVDIVRVAVPGLPDAEALPRIIAESAVPIIADIHFNASLAIRAMDAGVAAVRINPGNIGGEDKVREVVAKAQETSTPLRIGANSGSLPEHLKWTATSDPIGALVKAAMEEVELLEQLGFHDFKISVKSTSVPVMIGAYRMLAGLVPYPLHLGVTEAGTLVTGAVKSAIGIGTLLEEGIGDTIRVSLTPEPNGDRTREVIVAQEILQTMGLRAFTPLVAACPGCGRTTSTVFQELAQDIQNYVRERMPEWRLARVGVENMTLAVMGCVVNGPGESKHASIGISLPGTGEAPVAPVYVDGDRVVTLRGDNIAAEFRQIVDDYVSRKYPERASH